MRIPFLYKLIFRFLVLKCLKILLSIIIMEINNVQDIIDNLPYELVYKISTYILKPQSKELMYDLRHFHISKEKGIKIYKDRFNDEPDLIVSWFVNDICSYMNNYLPMMYGFVEKYYDIFFRLFKLKTKTKIKIINFFNIFS